MAGAEASAFATALARATGPLAVAGALTALMGQPARAQAPVAVSAVRPIPDPWEKNNRRALAFSLKADRAVIAPVVRGYVRVAPRPVRAAIGRAIHNLDEPRIAGRRAVLDGRSTTLTHLPPAPYPRIVRGTETE